MKLQWILGCALLVPALALAEGEDSTDCLGITGAVDAGDPQSWVFNVTQNDEVRVALECQEYIPDGEQHLVIGQPALSQTLTVRGLKADTTYECHARQTRVLGSISEPIVFTTDPLPEDLMVPRVVLNEQPLEDTGYTLFNLGNIFYDGDLREFDPELIYTSENYLVIMDAEGNVRWWLEGPGAGDIEANYLGNGHLLFSGQGVPVAYPPTIIGLDKEIELEGTQQLFSHFEFGNEFGIYYNHEGNLRYDGRSIFTFVHTLRPDSPVVGFVIREIMIQDADNDGVMEHVNWMWDAFQHAEKGQLNMVNELNPNDPVHANAISNELGPDGRLYVYVSLRNSSQILKIDYETKDVVWTLGHNVNDFMLLDIDGNPATEKDWFYNQHDVKVKDGLVTMYDNGFDRIHELGLPFTRALVLELDEANRVARIIHEYHEPFWMEPFWGGYDILENGHQLIAMGHCEFCMIPLTKPSALVELDSSNEMLWRAQYGPDQFDKMIYRAQRINGCDIFNNLTYCSRLADLVQEDETDPGDWADSRPDLDRPLLGLFGRRWR